MASRTRPPQGIIAPRLTELIRVEGEIDDEGPADNPVRNLQFRGLTFMHGDRAPWTPDDVGLQHDWEMYDKANALFRLRGAEDCVIDGCHFAHSGGTGIRVDLYGQRNQIVNNHIEYLGGTGILLCGYGPGKKDVNKSNVLYNNHIHHCGQILWHSPGIMVWQSGENRVAHNLIHHMPYSGIVLSGVTLRFFSRRGGRELAGTIRWHEIGEGPMQWTYDQAKPFLHTRRNVIEYNEIHHVMEKLADGNGIYIRGSGPDNVIRGNYIHDLLAPTRMQAGIRTDGEQRDTVIEGNVMYRCTSQGIVLKLNNKALNNYIVDVLESVHRGERVPPTYISLREGPMKGAVIQRNILFHSGTYAMFYDERNGGREQEPALLRDIDADYNIYWCAGDPELARAALEQLREQGVARHSLAVDPRFVDPARGDLRLRPDSPAFWLGIVPLDPNAARLVGD